ncbi:MAG: hypothetical protein ACKO23_14025 [Gemmataceae bacterium]
MMVRRLRWLMAVGVGLSWASLGLAQRPVEWRPAGSPPTLTQVSGPATATLDRPTPLGAKAATRSSLKPTVRAKAGEWNNPSFDDEPSHRTPPPPTANPSLSETTPTLDGESGITTPIGAELLPTAGSDGLGMAAPKAPRSSPPPHLVSQPPEDVPPPPIAPPGGKGADIIPGVTTDHSVTPGFWERCVDLVTFGDKGNAHGRCSFQSDACFPRMISPVTNPFYFEDPRSLTEIRPIFMYQGIPNSNPRTNGGSAFWFGSQFRLALTDRFSFVINELGFLSINPDKAVAPFQNGTGFSEIKLGPKYTFLRNTESNTVMAGGLIFEIPAGSGKVFQDTGTLSLDPYLSFGQTFGALPNGFGSINLLANTGYSFSMNNERADFYYLNFHTDWNIANFNTFYPLFEMNWMYYTTKPTSQVFVFEGQDLVNFGSKNRNYNNYLSLAGGLRYRFTDNVFLGAAAEFPVLGTNQGFCDYRLTFDFIFRY